MLFGNRLNFREPIRWRSISPVWGDAQILAAVELHQKRTMTTAQPSKRRRSTREEAVRNCATRISRQDDAMLCELIRKGTFSFSCPEEGGTSWTDTWADLSLTARPGSPTHRKHVWVNVSFRVSPSIWC
jgi:hypothetical protein